MPHLLYSVQVAGLSTEGPHGHLGIGQPVCGLDPVPTKVQELGLAPRR